MKCISFLIVSTLMALSFNAAAKGSLLKPLASTMEIRVLKAEVESQYDQLASDPHFTLVDDSQSFRILGADSEYLVAVSYFSREYKNQLCEIALVARHGEILSRVIVGGERSDGDEIAASCSAINAVSGRSMTTIDDVVLVVSRLRAGESYWNSGTILRINQKSHEIYIDRATRSINDQGNSSKITLKMLGSKTLMGR